MPRAYWTRHTIVARTDTALLMKAAPDSFASALASMVFSATKWTIKKYAFRGRKEG